MTPELRNLIKFLARIAVEQYLDELRASEKLLPSDEHHLARKHNAARITNAKE
jgi:hypothetical protein